MSALSPQGPPEPHLDWERGDAILAAVGFAADRSMHGADPSEFVQEVITKLGLAAESSRAYLYQNEMSGAGVLLMTQIAEWCAPGIAATMTDPENHQFPYYPRHGHYVETLGGGETLSLLRSTARGADLEDLEDEDVQASILVPVFLRDTWWGYLGFDDCHVERTWTATEIDGLNAVAAFICVTMARRSERPIDEPTAPTFRTLVERIPAITYIDVVNDPDEYPYPTLYMSPQTIDVLGYPPERFIEDPDFWDEIIHPDDAKWLVEEDLYSSAYENVGDRFEAEYRLIAADGRVVWVHDEAEQIAETPQQREVWHGVMYDITALKEEVERERDAADQLRSLDALKDVFLDAVSHELRTPVAAIMGLSLTLERDEGGLTEQERTEFAARISRNAHKLQRLIEDLLDMSRMNRGVLGLERHLARVDRVALKALHEADMPDTHPVAVEVDPVEAPIDASKVERIVENLLSNAVRHTPDGTSVALTVRSALGGVLVGVDDDGPGVPAAMKELIFQPFRQAEQHPQGAGLGLSLVAKFAELHGGRAWVEDGPTGGAWFRVFLPED